MSFEAIVPVQSLEAALDPVDALVDECKVRLNEDALSIRAVDPANVGMVDMTLDEAAFETYDADSGVIGVNLDRLLDVVGMGSSGDLVHLALDESTRKLEIEIDELSYTLALIDPDSIRKEPDIPDLDLPASVAFEGEQFARAVTATDLVSDHIRMDADPDAEAVVFSADGDTDDVELTLGADEIVSADVDEAVGSLFSLDYLEDMTRPVDSDVIVSLRLGSEMPVKFRYQAAEHVSVENLLAPRIQSE